VPQLAPILLTCGKFPKHHGRSAEWFTEHSDWNRAYNAEANSEAMESHPATTNLRVQQFELALCQVVKFAHTQK
jgi:hypothetical protein